jgi:beta-galactosidase
MKIQNNLTRAVKTVFSKVPYKLLTAFLCVTCSIAPAHSSSLTWETEENIDLFKQHGVKKGSVTSAYLYRKIGLYTNWDNKSNVTYQTKVDIPGQYRIQIEYTAKNPGNGRIFVGTKEYPVPYEANESPKGLSIGLADIDRVGVHTVKMIFSDPSLVIHGFNMSTLRAEVNVSKPILIAGGDHVRLEASVALAKGIKEESITFDAEIHEWPNGKTLWTGEVLATKQPQGYEIAHTIKNLSPKKWSPENPNLYNFKLKVRQKSNKSLLQTANSRFGFRDFEVRDGKFFLNGRAIFLRGHSINPPGTANRNLNPDLDNDPVAVRKILETYKANHINLIRVDSPLWISLCDELGLMVFGGQYTKPKWGGASWKKAPVYKPDALVYYKNIFQRYTNHPSFVIRVLSNEMPRPQGETGEGFQKFFKKVHEELQAWDPNRADIDNAGFGLGLAGNIYDLHTYMGWYNGTHHSYNKFRHDLRKLAGFPSPKQPITFTECVGAYTDHMGRAVGNGKQVAASLRWLGDTMDIPKQALEYQNYLAKNSIETLRRLRSINPDLAGFMPFTSSATQAHLAKTADEIRWNPMITEAYKTSYQPVLLSWENYQPHLYAGRTLSLPTYITNDADDGRNLRGIVVKWKLINTEDSSVALKGDLTFDKTIPHYQVGIQTLSIDLPSTLKTAQYILTGSAVEDGKVISKNETKIYIAQKPVEKITRKRVVRLYDPLNHSRKVFEKAGLRLGIDYQITKNLFTSDLSQLSGSEMKETLGVTEIEEESTEPKNSLLIIGTSYWPETISQRHREMQAFVKAGGRVLLLYPNPSSLDALDIYREVVAREKKWFGDQESALVESLWHTSRDFGVFINPRRTDNGIFENITREQLRFWSDSTGWNHSKSDLPPIEPVNKLISFRNAESLESTAALASFSRGLEYLALAEVFKGEGSVILSGFDFDRFAGIDPISDRVLRNLITYAADDEKHQIVPRAKESIDIGSVSDETGIIQSETHNGLYISYDGDKTLRLISGPFWYNRLCHMKLLNHDEKIRRGFLYLRAPEGKSQLVLRAKRVSNGRNKGKFTPEELVASINGNSVRIMVPDVNELELNLPLPNTVGDIFRLDLSGTSDTGISFLEFK